MYLNLKSGVTFDPENDSIPNEQADVEVAMIDFELPYNLANQRKSIQK